MYVYEDCKIWDSNNNADEDSSCEIWCVLVYRHQHTQFEIPGDWSLQYVLFKCNSSVTQLANTEGCIWSCGCVHDAPSVKMTCARWITVHRNSMTWFSYRCRTHPNLTAFGQHPLNTMCMLWWKVLDHTPIQPKHFISMCLALQKGTKELQKQERHQGNSGVVVLAAAQGVICRGDPSTGVSNSCLHHCLWALF
jgi:hypothetical protein